MWYILKQVFISVSVKVMDSSPALRGSANIYHYSPPFRCIIVKYRVMKIAALCPFAKTLQRWLHQRRPVQATNKELQTAAMLIQPDFRGPSSNRAASLSCNLFFIKTTRLWFPSRLVRGCRYVISKTQIIYGKYVQKGFL